MTTLLQMTNAHGKALVLALMVFCASSFADIAYAGEADVVKAVASESGGQFRFDVTVRSNDKGWDYYCDRFEILSPDGRLLGTRILYHPHESEQPFTRSSDLIEIAKGIQSVVVRARMKPTGESGDTVSVKLPGR